MKETAIVSYMFYNFKIAKAFNDCKNNKAYEFVSLNVTKLVH
jgi:hypothetical protein